MNFKDITTWSVSKGVATPINPYKEHNDKSRFAIVQKSHIGLYANFVRDYGNIKLATNAPDGSYSADCFGEIEKQHFHENKWYKIENGHHLIQAKENGDEIRDFMPFIKTKGEFIIITQTESEVKLSVDKFLPFIDQVKEAESPKFGEWISVEDRLPEKAGFYWVSRNVVSTHTDDNGSDVIEVEQEKIYYFKEPNVTGWQKDWTNKPSNVTNWMPLPSPPKTL